jgi:glycerate 2-kinase
MSLPLHRADSASVAAIAIWRAGVQAVLGNAAVARSVRCNDEELTLGEAAISRHEFDRVLVVGGGKATAAMASGLLDRLGDKIPIRGWINVPEGTVGTLEHSEIHVCQARPPGVNEPTAEAVAGTEAILSAVASASSRDLCIVLLSGGGSALLVAPAHGVSLADKLLVTRYLSAAGASIVELNTVRKHLSRIKGGRLRRACRAGRTVTLVLSDVIGDPLDVIASGPTVADSTTTTDARAVLTRLDPGQTLPESVYRCLAKREERGHPSNAQSEIVVVGNNAAAIDAAGIKAESLGFAHAMHAAVGQEGTAESVGEKLAEMAVSMLRQRDRSTSAVNCLITGGEPVVRLAPPEIRGKGGRNQQLVLAAMIALRSDPEFSQADRERLVLLSGGTDGEDGPTDAAGAILSESVWKACADQSLMPEDYLRRNDAYTFFQKTGGLLITGPTGTNVCDLRVVTISQSS